MSGETARALGEFLIVWGCAAGIAMVLFAAIIGIFILTGVIPIHRRAAQQPPAEERE